MRRRGVLVFSAIGTAFCGFLLATVAAGQPASLLADINTDRGSHPSGGGHLAELREAGGKLYFVVGAGSPSRALWVSDGTSAGTQILRDLCAGQCNSGIKLLGSMGNLMLLTVDGDLWRSDGTRAGTFPLAVHPLPPALEAHALHAFFRGAFFFVTCASTDRTECDLWRTDGSLGGAHVIRHTPLGIPWLAVADDRLFHVEKGNSSGVDLWAGDGTAAGTAAVHHFDSYQLPTGPVAAGHRLFFFAPQNGDEVWASDGTAAGTRAVTNFAPPTPFLQFSRWLKPAGDRVYFVADDVAHGPELWRADGTTNGTVRVTELRADTPLDAPTATSIAIAGNLVVFLVDDEDTGDQVPWTSRGTTTTTARLSCGGCIIDPFFRALVAGGDRVFFMGGFFDPQLWSTDGTAGGTHQVTTTCNGCDDGPLVPWQGGVLFVEHDLEYEGQIWFTNGTVQGTLPFTSLIEGQPAATEVDILASGGNTYFVARNVDFVEALWVREAAGSSRRVFVLDPTGPTSNPQNLTAFRDRLLFTASEQDEIYSSAPVAMWSSSGTPESTARLPLANPRFASPRNLAEANGLLFFEVGDTFDPPNLWRTDGTAAGTFVVAHLQEDAVAAPFQGALYFFDGGWIWRTDGTVAGTVKTGELPAEVLTVDRAAAGPNGIYLRTVTAPYRSEFWFTDGTTAGTRQLTNFNLGGTIGFEPEFTAVGPYVYFTFVGLWRTDGTPAGTSAVSLPGLSAQESPMKLVGHRGSLYLFTTAYYASPYDLRLWRVDGTTGVELHRFPGEANFHSPYAGLNPIKLAPRGGTLYFNVTDGAHGIELWATDGTAAGTAMVADILPGPQSSAPGGLTAAGDRLYFAARDSLHGEELWQSDGTAAGTSLVQDIAPSAGWSSPGQLTVAGDHLFFTADDGLTGRELWALSLGASTACRPSSTRLCLSGGRYAVESTWQDFSGNHGVGHAAALTSDTGYFWFFSPSNVEVIVKLLDGDPVNGHAWVFYGALSNVGYSLTVTDTQTGLSRRYVNPPGQLASVGDVNAFGPLGASAKAWRAPAIRPSSPPVVTAGGTAPAPCVQGPTRLCLNGGRFAVDVAWKDFQGSSGVGQAQPLTSDTGWFWFFGPDNVEVVIKVLDGVPVNGHFWLFYGALSSVEYTLTVTDTQTGQMKTYRNPSGRLASVADVSAF